jgi:Flp pilus assembly protein TadG
MTSRLLEGGRRHAPADPPGVERGEQRGQALIETAITIPVLLTLMLGFLFVMVVAQAYVDVDTATSLAATAAVSAPADNPTLSHSYAQKSYDGTLRRSGYLEPGALGGCGGYAAGSGATVTCTGSATVFLSRTPMAILQPLNSDWRIDIEASSVGYSSRYRST